MSKPWGNIGTWAAEAEREEEEMEAAAASAAKAPPPDTKSYPSLREAVTTKPKKKKMSLNEFYSVSSTNSSSRQSKGLTPDEMVRLPTGPRERGPDEMQQPRGFNNYGSREEYGGGGRRQYGGGFDDDQRRGGGGGPGSSRVSDYDQVSRADEADNWSMGKKSLPSMDSGRQSRYGSLGSGGGGASRADEVDNWASDKKPMSFAPPSRSSNFGFRSSGPENDRWTRGGGGGGGSNEVEQERSERPRLVLNPPKVDVAITVTEVSKTNKPNPFGTARPREEVLADKGMDWRKLETDLESKKSFSHSSRPTSAHSSRPSSAHSGRSETVVPAGLLQQGLENVERPAKPKVNPFGDAKPREVLLQERGQDWRKMDRELEHRSIDRPETEEEKLLKEEINKLKEDVQKGPSVQENKEPVQVSDGNQSSLKEIISQKEKELETLIRDLDDRVRFCQKPLERPGSGAGRSPAFSDRPPSRSGSVDESRNTEFMDRPRSRGAPDIWTRPVDERRPYQGGRGERGFLGNREFDRPRSRDRW